MPKDGIRVAEFLTEMPPKKELEKKVHKLLLETKERIERNTLVWTKIIGNRDLETNGQVKHLKCYKLKTELSFWRGWATAT